MPYGLLKPYTEDWIPEIRKIQDEDEDEDEEEQSEEALQCRQ